MSGAMQEQYLSRELELMLERLESPAWNLVPQPDRPATVSTAAAARVPAAYQPQVYDVYVTRWVLELTELTMYCWYIHLTLAMLAVGPEHNRTMYRTNCWQCWR